MEDQQAARCVLWCAAAPPTELLDALARRRVIVTQTTDPYRALATLCRLHAGRDGVPPVLLLVQPSRPAAADLARAAWTYAPRAAVWMFDPSSNPQLRGVVEADADGWAQSASHQSDNGAPTKPKVVVMPGGGLNAGGTIARIGGPGMGGSPRPRENDGPARASALRLSHDSGVERGPVRDDDLGPAGTESGGRPRPLLSPEEIAMLLSEQPEQGRG
jgi:hypothetical protein